MLSSRYRSLLRGFDSGLIAVWSLSPYGSFRSLASYHGQENGCSMLGQLERAFVFTICFLCFGLSGLLCSAGSIPGAVHSTAERLCPH